MNDWIRWIAIASIALYLLFDFIDARRVEDEREKLVQLKALELAHKITMACLTVAAAGYGWYPGLDAKYVILALIAAALYGEVLAKIWYRARI